MDQLTTPLRVATWNLERRGTPDRRDLMESERLDLLLAQEVTASAYEAVAASGLFAWSAVSLHFEPRLVRNSRSERLGVAVFGGSNIQLRLSGILPWLERPEKLVHAAVKIPGWREPVTLASYHASPGDGKPECSLQVAHWLELQFGPAILGLDANSPDVDHPDHAQSVFHWQQEPFAHCEPALIGPASARRHRLEDALRRWFGEHPDDLASIAAHSPSGPLACTYDRGAAGRFKPSRFDSIWVSPEFQVDTVQHLWDDVAGVPLGGSDHAMVVTELRPLPPARRAPRQRVVDHVVEHGLVEPGAELHFAADLLLDATARATVEGWASDNATLLIARFTGDRARPLEWSGGPGTFTIHGLAAHVCESAGVELPSDPPGPHWWRDHAGRSLVEISDGVG